jgi:replicative DNA helicase
MIDLQLSRRFLPRYATDSQASRTPNFRKLEPMANSSSYAPALGPDTGLPSNVAAEKMILGAILLENQAISEAEEKLTPEDFSLDSHQRIYQRMTELGGTGHAIDLVTLANELAKYKEIESVGGVAYLSSLTEGLPRRPVIEEYIRIVKDKSLLRQLMLICSAAIARAADQSETALDVLNAAESQLMVVGEKSVSKGLASLEEIVAGSFGSIDNLYSQAREVTGLETHFTEFDKMTSGLQRANSSSSPPAPPWAKPPGPSTSPKTPPSPAKP